MSDHDPKDEALDELDTEVVEDLDVDDAEDVKGGTSGGCLTL